MPYQNAPGRVSRNVRPIEALAVLRLHPDLAKAKRELAATCTLVYQHPLPDELYEVMLQQQLEALTDCSRVRTLLAILTDTLKQLSEALHSNEQQRVKLQRVLPVVELQLQVSLDLPESIAPVPSDLQ